MKTTLSEIVEAIVRDAYTGLLSLLLGDNSMIKMYFKNGALYHTTRGNQKEDLLKYIASVEFSAALLLPNVKLDVHTSNLPSVTEIIRVSQGKTIDIKQPNGKDGGPPAAGVSGASDFARIRHELQVMFKKQVGPAGEKIMAKIIEEKWRVATPTKADIARLISFLRDEIEGEKNKESFIEEAENLIS